MDLELVLASYTVTAIPRRARHGVGWHKVPLVAVPALTGPLDVDLRSYVATHVPRRSRSRLVWVPAPRER